MKTQDPELIKYLREKSFNELNESFEGASIMANWLNAMTDKYDQMSIKEFKNEVIHYESLKQLCSDIERSVLKNKIEPKNIDALINILKYGKLQLSKPQHDKSKTKVKNKITVEYLQNLIDKLESNVDINNIFISNRID